MEHVRLMNGKEYELVVGGFSTTARDQLKIMFDPGTDTFEQIEAVFNNPANVERIEVVDTANEVFEEMCIRDSSKSDHRGRAISKWCADDKRRP